MNRQSSRCGQWQDSSDRSARKAYGSIAGKTFERRAVLKHGLALAAVGGVIAGSDAASAQASSAATLPDGFAPAVVALTDAPRIAVDASLGNDFRVTIGADRTMANPSNALDGQQIIFQVTQGASSPCTLTWDNGYEFSAGLPQPTLSTVAGQTDLLGFIYNAAKASWLLAAFVGGFD